jgi:hypothetical protein
MTIVDFDTIYNSALGVATNIAAITSWTPQPHIDWCRGYLDAHCHLLNLISEKEPYGWQTIILEQGQLNHQQTMERLRNL